MEGWKTAKEVAKELGVSVRTVWSRAKAGSIQSKTVKDGKRRRTVFKTGIPSEDNKHTSKDNSELLEVLQKTIEDLRKDKAELIRVLDQQQKLTAQLQTKLPQLEAPKDIPEDKPEKANRKGFLKRLFGL